MLKIKINQSLYNTKLNWNVDLELKPGIAYQLRGENGLGKTSLIEEVKIAWSKLNPDLRYSFTDQENLNGFQDLSIEGFLDVFWEVTQERHSGVDWREGELFKKSQKLWKKNIRQLSGGENQWIKILMMISLESDVWILDEPFQSLDAQRQTELNELLQGWLFQGKYLLIVHHGELHLSPKANIQIIHENNILSARVLDGH